MKFGDLYIFFGTLLAILVVGVVLELVGVRAVEPDDYSQASIIAAFNVVLFAIREAREPQP